MLWFVLSAFTAVSKSVNDALNKKILKNNDEYSIVLFLKVASLIFLLPLIFFIQIPEINSSFWTALLVSGTLNIIIVILFMKAIKNSDISLILPLAALTPAFLLITSPLITKEFPNLQGVFGICLIVLGSYFLNISKAKTSLLKPFKELLNDKGARLMLLVAFLWSITSNFDKIGVQNSSPIFWIISINIFTIILLLPIFLKKSTKKALIKNDYKIIFLIGFIHSLALIAQMTALNLTLVAYVISIKRSSVVISTLLGYLFFKEKKIKERLAGAIIMFLGVVIIGLS